MRCVKQYLDFLNHHFLKQVAKRHRLESLIPSELLILIAEFCAESHGIVIDGGSGHLRAGYVGDDAPRTRFRNFVSTYNVPRDHNGGDNVAFWIGGEVPGNLRSSTRRFDYRPIDRGIIQNWDDMERIWKHTFVNDLRVDPTDHPILLTEPPLNPKANRERMAKIMFETFGVPALYVITRNLLALFATNRTTGCVVHSGHSSTNVVPIYEGHILHHTVMSLAVAGCDLDQHLRHLIDMRGIRHPLGLVVDSAERELIRDIKETVCFVSLDFEDDMQRSAVSSVLEKPFELPDGSILTLGSERFCCPEALFRPNQVGLERDGIATMTTRAIEACSDDIEVQRLLYSNIVLSGGSTRFPGFNERLTKEINNHLAVAQHPSFQIPPIKKSRQENTHYSWIGGSAVACLPHFQRRWWITSEEYKEFGPSIIHQDLLHGHQ